MMRDYWKIAGAATATTLMVAGGCGSMASSSGSNCKSDGDCKGNRVCLAGSCTDPPGASGTSTASGASSGGQTTSSASAGTGGGQPGGKRVFISSVYYDGNLGGLDGADAKCSTLAAGAALGGTWTAWLSQSSNPLVKAADRIKSDGPWYLVDKSTKVFYNKVSLAGSPLVAINRDEHGDIPPSNIDTVWTGTLNGGDVSAKDCGGWTSQNGVAIVGYWPDKSLWTFNGSDAGCNGVIHLYCFEE